MNGHYRMTAMTFARSGITFGSALAIAISWSQSSSILCGGLCQRTNK